MDQEEPIGRSRPVHGQSKDLLMARIYFWSPLSEVENSFERMESGEVLRSVVVFE